MSSPARTASDRRTSDIERTYYSLRFGMVVLAVLLFGSICYEWVSASLCLQSSISAYYYTPVRPVFIAALCAIGAGLVIYRGNDPTENALFNVAGPLAFLVAFVPTGYEAEKARCGALEVPYKAVAIPNNISALILAGIVAVFVVLLQFKDHETDSEERTATYASLAATVAVFAAVAIVFFTTRDFFLTHAHMGSAIAFFALIMIVIYRNSRSAPTPHGSRYRAIFWTVVALGALLIVFRFTASSFATFVFWLEAVGIAGFMGFWIIQTREIQGKVDRHSN